VNDTGPRRYLLIFDCDGVLVDSEATSNRVLTKAITEAGVPMGAQEVAETFEGMRLVDIQAEVEKRLGSRLPPRWLADFEAERAAAFEEGLDPVPGVADVLAKASGAGVPVCVASQARQEKTELTLRLTGLSGFFRPTSLFSSVMVERGKPHPDLFLFAAEAMGFEPADCIVVEDGVPGVEAGCSAGMRVLGYGPDSRSERLADAGAEVFASMAELPPLLGLS
jgi:HAD superfamily hydrolase (TIGR01509 family)